MSVTSVPASSIQAIGNSIIQQLMANSASTQGTSGQSSSLGDLLTLSPASQQLAQAPAAVTQAMSDLFNGQSSVTTDLTQLQSYFQQNPQSLTSVLSALQGGSSTYNASGAVSSTTSTSSIISSLESGQGSASDRTALLSLLGSQNQDPLLASLNGSTSSSQSGLLSLLG